MGASNGKNILKNQSKGAIRLFLTDKPVQKEAFVEKVNGKAEAAKFRFREDVKVVCLPAGETEERQLKEGQFLSVFAEYREEEEEVFAKAILLNMAVPSSITILLYDV